VLERHTGPWRRGTTIIVDIGKLNQCLVRRCWEPTDQSSEEEGGLGLPDARRVEPTGAYARPAAPVSVSSPALKPAAMPGLPSPPRIDDLLAPGDAGGPHA
jgi:hypothetical protein